MLRLARASLLAGLATVAATAVLTPASAAPAASADVQVLISARLVREQSIPPLFADGATTTVSRLNFLGGVGVLNAGPDSTTVKVRFELPSGLDFGADGPDPSESCTEGRIAICEVALGNDGASSDQGWEWDMVAERAGSYVVKATVVESSTPDPNSSNNVASVTFAVSAAPSTTPPPPPPPPAAIVAASRVTIAPVKPKAGSTLVASVRVTKGGSPVRPTRVGCSASIGAAKVKGAPRSASGVASCLFKTPKSGKGKTLAGTVLFRTGGQSFARRFAVRLR